MKIKSVHLSNYKRFTDLRISDIPEQARLVVLIGPNGSGKSSLFDAFLVKSWASRNNYSMTGNKEYEGYYNKDSQGTWGSTGQLANAISVEFHSDRAPTGDEWARAFNIRSAYRNEADFRVDTLKAVQPSHTATRFQRIIETDQSVSDNFNRLAWKRQSDIDKDAPGEITIAQYRKEFLTDLQTAMADLFKDPTLNLQDFGGVRDAGTFRFSKGATLDFHYKNLSGGEKAAFDLLLDIFVKRHEYSDAIYCVDEPESHVATALHGPLLNAMLQLIPEESQLWIATHSIGFVRRAFELKKEYGNVEFIDFSGQDFDCPVALEPRVPNRSFWHTTYKVAMDDLADLITPESIVICEGDKDSADKGFDADCYNKIFSDTHPETLFVSYGSSGEVARSENLISILQAVAKGVKVWRLIDRDDMTDTERDRKIRDGMCVLKRREIENYLYDPAVLETFLENRGQSNVIDKILQERQRLLDSAPTTDDVESVTQELFQSIRSTTRLSDLGNSRREFALYHLVPALSATQSVRDDLAQVIF